jgi:hypothetical protein
MPRLGARLAPTFRPRIGRRSRSSTLPDPSDDTHDTFFTPARLVRELIVLVSALLFGFIAVPLLIWLVGSRVLGPYTHGTNTHAGAMALLGDFFVGLGRGEITFWIVALGPLVLILLARGAWYLITSNPAAERSVAKDRL